MDWLVEIEIACPHCGEVFPLEIDTSQGDHVILEDCTVCCRPITLRLECRPGEVVRVTTDD
jgi:uncharacterized Zn finger protein